MGYDGSPDGSWDPVTGLGTINYQVLIGTGTKN